MLRGQSEGQLQDEIRIALSGEPGLVLFRNNTGVAKQGDRYVKYGLMPGSADLIGVLDGRFVSMELKTPKGRVAEDQERWANLIRSKGGFACIVRSIDEAKAAIQRAREGASE